MVDIRNDRRCVANWILGTVADVPLPPPHAATHCGYMSNRFPRPQFTIAALLTATFWFAAICSAGIAFARVYRGPGGSFPWLPWYLRTEWQSQLRCLSLVIGLGLGGVVGAFI